MDTLAQGFDGLLQRSEPRSPVPELQRRFLHPHAGKQRPTLHGRVTMAGYDHPFRQSAVASYPFCLEPDPEQTVSGICGGAKSDHPGAGIVPLEKPAYRGEDEGWVRVHSDEDENKSEEEFLTQNLLREFVENIFGLSKLAPAQADIVVWWDKHPEIDAMIPEYASKIAAEWHVDSMMERDFSRPSEPETPDVSLLDKIQNLPVGPAPMGGEITEI